jgi:hypothetical protein
MTKYTSGLLLSYVMARPTFKQLFINDGAEEIDLVQLMNKKNWKRRTKEKQKGDVEIPSGDVEEINKALLGKVAGTRPWVRVFDFEPKESLGRDYRIEIMTTTDDTEIVGWSMSGD